MALNPLALVACVVGGLVLGGCEQKMTDQPRYEPYEEASGEETSGWPADQSARQPVKGTVARDDNLAPTPDNLPLPLTRQLLEQGQQRFEIYCTPCHGQTGYGDGMVVQRGFPAPPSFHSKRLRQLPLRHYYDVITNGYGVMYSYRARVTADERWAIAAYIRALQLSQHGRVDDLTPEQKTELESTP